MISCLHHIRTQITDPPRREREVRLKRKAETRATYPRLVRSRNAQIVVQRHKRRGCKKLPKQTPPTKKAKGPSSLNGKERANTRSATREKDKTLLHQPHLNPTKFQKNYGLGELGWELQQLLSCKLRQPNPKSTRRPKAISASQPTKTSQKPTARPSTKPSSSKAIGSRPRFCVRHVGGGPHVSPQKLRQMAKLPPRAWGII
ncbi:hypothetical protein PIB30_045566 [Stylosanthes scabra]|uniref:Uncharacterized protein n=1 Tax=Stylosanthes scabra TaxID=79078 RepID=A0ABU6XHE7_9FABA|nr:hypothetical protein [Stylosanthes scabra]